MKENRRLKSLVAMLLAFVILLTSTPISVMAASQLSRPTSLKVDLKNWEFSWKEVSRAEGYTVRLYERESTATDPGPDEYLTSKYTDTNSISMDRFTDVMEDGNRYFFRVIALSESSRYDDSEISGCSGDFSYSDDHEEEDEEELDGWQKISGYWYYYKNGKLLKDQWLTLKEDGEKYHYYLDQKGRRISSEWYEIDGKEYHFDSDGRMESSKWISQNFHDYYVGADGAMYKNREAKIGARWYEFDSRGRATQIAEPTNNTNSNTNNNTSKFAGFQRDSAGYWYYYENGIAVKNDWRCLLSSSQQKVWYFFDDSGKMLTSKWQQYKGKWYYLGPNGVMVTSKWQKDKGEWYYLGADGAMITSSWVENKYYVDKDGKMYHDCQKTINGTMYTFDSNGVGTEVYYSSIYTSAGNTPGYWLPINGTWAFFYNDGRQATPGTWITWNGRWAYIDADYRAVQNRYADIKGTRYWFDKNCYLYDSKPIK